jgi:DNA-binding response OmpR family regulator
MRILVVEDEPVLAEATVEALRLETYAVDLACDGSMADELMAVNDYDAVVLDWTIPPPSGLELLAAWRGAGRSTPILMLTGRDSVEDRVKGLDHGADDYLTKPFSLAELLARVRSLLRRRGIEVQAELVADDLTVDRAGRRVVVADHEVDLTPKEFCVLEYLLTRCDQVVSRGDLIEHAWDGAFDPMSNVVDVVVHRLRRKIDGDREERLLHTVKGAGYMLRSRRTT